MRSSKRIGITAGMIAGLIGVWGASSARADLTVTPIPPYQFNTTISGGTPTFTIAGDANPTTATVPQPGLGGAAGMYPYFTFFNLADGWTKTGGGFPSQTNLISFDISVANITPTAGNNLVVMIGVGSSTSTTIIPIAAADLVSAYQQPTLCTTTNANCVFPTSVGAATLYQGAIIPNPPTASVIRIGIYPKDLCASGAQTALLTFCNGANVLNPNSATLPVNSSTSVPLFFYIQNAQFGATTPPPTSGAVATAPQINLQIFDAPIDIEGIGGTAPGGSCNPFQTAPYFPGDGQINLNSGTMLPVTNQGGQTTPGNLLVVGTLGGVAPAPATFAVNSFPISVETNYTGQNTITGFQNSLPGGQSFDYTLYFSYVDSSGIIGQFSCFTTGGVETTAILGFLGKNSCFVATGAFHGEEALGIRLLQSFRDQVLNHSRPGRALRDWYYSWSPRAGWWLLDHPEFRLPVLQFLVPFEAAAWVLLHPLLAGVLGLLGISIIFSAAFMRTRKGEETA